MKRSAAAIVVFMFVAIALLAARSSARSHPTNAVLETVEQRVTSLNDDDFSFIPCNKCGICTKSLPPICVCEDVSLLGCREGCERCQSVVSPFIPLGFRCLDFALYKCKNHPWFPEPITTTTGSIN